MLYLNNPFTKVIHEFSGKPIAEIESKGDRVYLENGVILQSSFEGKFFDQMSNEKYGAVFEAAAPNEIGRIVGYALIDTKIS